MHGKVNVTEVTLGSGSPVVGLTLREVELPENSLVACILRDKAQGRLAPVLKLCVGHVLIRSICAPQARSFSSTRSYPRSRW